MCLSYVCPSQFETNTTDIVHSSYARVNTDNSGFRYKSEQFANP